MLKWFRNILSSNLWKLVWISFQESMGKKENYFLRNKQGNQMNRPKHFYTWEVFNA